MPMATPDHYVAMLDRAKEGGFAYPAINVTSSQTLNAALQGFADADSDGIIQVSLGTALYLSGNTVRNRFAGSKALALYAHEVALHYSVTVALHTDHCPAENLDDWVRPLIADSKNVAAAAWTRCINRTCGTGPRSLSTKTCASREDCWSRRRSEHAPRDRGRRDRRRGGRRVPRDQRTAVLHRRRCARHRRGTGDRGARSVPDRADLRQRARGLQPGFGPSAPGDPRGDPDRRRRRNRKGQAVRPGLPRSIGIERRGQVESALRPRLRVVSSR